MCLPWPLSSLEPSLQPVPVSPCAYVAPSPTHTLVSESRLRCQVWLHMTTVSPAQARGQLPRKVADRGALWRPGPLGDCPTWRPRALTLLLVCPYWVDTCIRGPLLMCVSGRTEPEMHAGLREGFSSLSSLPTECHLHAMWPQARFPGGRAHCPPLCCSSLGRLH